MSVASGSRLILAHTRGGTVPVLVEGQDEIPADAVMIVEDGHGARLAARVASMVTMPDFEGETGSREDEGPTQDRPVRGSSPEALVDGVAEVRDSDSWPTSSEPFRLIEVMCSDPDGGVWLGDVVACDDIAQRGEHDWGALGLPLGAETRLSSEPPVDDDVGAALASAGHRLTVESATHEVMPGDEIVRGGSTWLVVAIDRRNDRMTVRANDGEEREVAFRQTMLEAG